MNKRDICESGKNAFVKTPAFFNLGVFQLALWYDLPLESYLVWLALTI